MTTTVNPIPSGYHTATPYLIVRDAEAALDFYTKAFGAQEKLRLQLPGGPVGHAEIQIGDSNIMLGEAMPEMGIHAPKPGDPAYMHLYLYVSNVDELFAQAVNAGATVLRPLQDQFYGDRTGAVWDPFGHEWTIGTHVEDVPQDEIMRRYAEMVQAEN